MFRVTDHTRRSDTGRKRTGNEDASYARVPLFVIADGMGGAAAGEVASRIAVDAFGAGLPDGPGPIEQRLASLIAEANRRVHAQAVEDPKLAGMGTTCTAAYLDTEELVVAHVGDSRCYRLRDGRLQQITEDHSLVGELVRRGEMSEEEAESHPQRSIITRALGPEPEVEVDHMTVPVRDGDCYLLCSDGLTDMLADDEIERILAGGTLDEQAGQLIDAANSAGGRDNITIVLFRVGEILGGVGGDQPTSESAALPRPAPVADRVSPEPLASPPGHRRRSPILLSLSIVLLVVALLAGGLWLGSRSVSFLGVDDEGFVTLYQGLPYELPGLPLYQEQYVSGLPAESLPARSRGLVTDHELRTQDDAVDLIRQLEQGTIDRRF